MTRYKAVAQISRVEPERLDHTFYVETVLCDEAAERAHCLATAQPPGSDPIDQTKWLYLGKASALHGPGLTSEAREFQRSWLRDHAGLAEGDTVAQSIRSTTTGSSATPA